MSICGPVNAVVEEQHYKIQHGETLLVNTADGQFQTTHKGCKNVDGVAEMFFIRRCCTSGHLDLSQMINQPLAEENWLAAR